MPDLIARHSQTLKVYIREVLSKNKSNTWYYEAGLSLDLLV